MNLEAIRIVVALHEHGSTSAVAKLLPYSRATIRRRLDTLEHSLGVKLFHRTSTGLLPTDAGRVLARRGREMLAEAEALADTVRQVGGTPRGCVRLAVPAGLPPSAVADFRQVMAQLLPEVRFELRIGSCSLDKLFGEIDLAVSFREPPARPAFDVLPIGIARTRLLASPAYLAAHSPIEDAMQVREHPLFVWIPPDDSAPNRLPRQNGPALAIEPACACEDIFALRHMAARGDGLAYVPDGFTEPIEVGPLVPVLPEVFSEERPFWLVVAKANSDAPAVRAVLEVARTVVAAGGATRG